MTAEGEQTGKSMVVSVKSSMPATPTAATKRKMVADDNGKGTGRGREQQQQQQKKKTKKSHTKIDDAKRNGREKKKREKSHK